MLVVFLAMHVFFFVIQNENKCKEKEKFHQVNSDGIKSYRNAGYASWDPPWWRQCDSIYPHVSYYTLPWIRVWASHEWRNENLFSGNYLPTNVIPEIFEWSTIFGKCILPCWFCFSIRWLEGWCVCVQLKKRSPWEGRCIMMTQINWYMENITLQEILKTLSDSWKCILRHKKQIDPSIPGSNDVVILKKLGKFRRVKL